MLPGALQLHGAPRGERRPIAPQVSNGHVLDQTVWNYDFEPGTDKLTGGGLEHLAYLARRRPQPDPMVYLQTAQDVAYDPASPDKLAATRAGTGRQARRGRPEVPAAPDGRPPRRLPGAGPRSGRGRACRRAGRHAEYSQMLRPLPRRSADRRRRRPAAAPPAAAAAPAP